MDIKKINEELSRLIEGNESIFETLTEEETKREVKQIKFVTVDDWNRPIFKMEHNGKKYYLSDVNNLFSYGESAKTIKDFYSKLDKPLREYITYHGTRVGDEPMGTSLKFDLELV